MSSIQIDDDSLRRSCSQKKQWRPEQKRAGFREVKSLTSLDGVRAAAGLPPTPSWGTTPAEKLAECAICFEALCRAPVGVFAHEGKRTCRHIFHMGCAGACPKKTGCPLCRASYDDIWSVPPITAPLEWFETMDFNRDGCLDHREVLYAVRATMAVDSEAIEEILPVMWSAWGAQPEEPLGFAQLLGPAGLLRHLCQTVEELPSKPESPQKEATKPELAIDKRSWFRHWDTDDNGVLVREEIVRGLAKSFQSDVPNEVCEKRLRMRCVVEEMWPLIDVDGNDRITLDEFAREGGLADMVMERFTAVGDRRPTRRPPRPKPRPRRTRSDLMTRTWTACTTDLSDDGFDDRPFLFERRALGFRKILSSNPTEYGSRKSTLQWASTEGNLKSWAKSASWAPQGVTLDFEEGRDFTDGSDGSDDDSVSDDSYSFQPNSAPAIPRDEPEVEIQENSNCSDAKGTRCDQRVPSTPAEISHPDDVADNVFWTFPFSSSWHRSESPQSPDSPTSPWGSCMTPFRGACRRLHSHDDALQDRRVSCAEAAAAARRRNGRSSSGHSTMQHTQQNDPDQRQTSGTPCSQGGAVYATDSFRNHGGVKDRFGIDNTNRRPEFSDSPDRSHVQAMVSQVYQRLSDGRSKRSSVSQDGADANGNSQSDRGVRRAATISHSPQQGRSQPSLRRVASARATQRETSDDRRKANGQASRGAATITHSPQQGRSQSHPSLRRVASARAAQAEPSDDMRGEHGQYSFYRLPPPRPELHRSESR